MTKSTPIVMTPKTSLILQVMHVIFWIIFTGLCIEAGAILTSFMVGFFASNGYSEHLYKDLQLSELYAFDIGHYVAVASLLFSIAAAKAYIAYLVVRIFMKFDLSKPFNAGISLLISQISHVALGTGILAMLANGYVEGLLKRGITVPVRWESGEFLFLSGIIFIIAEIFKKGTALQTESELTV